MKKTNLTVKLSMLLLSIILASTVILGLYFDTFLKESFLQTTQKRMLHGFQRLSGDITSATKDIKKGIAFIQTDESTLASIDLINNYQDKNDYNAVLLDEEKKSIALVLLNKVRFALMHDIALYDQNEELIAYVTKEESGYYLHFISYENGAEVIYCKHENAPIYTKDPLEMHHRIELKHISYYKDEKVLNNDMVTHHLYDHNVYIKSHRSILEQGNKKVQAHVEMSFQFGQAYLDSLSQNLDMTITLSRDGRYAPDSHPILNIGTLSEMPVKQTDENYVAVTHLDTKDGPIYFVATLNNAQLKSALNENRQKLILILILVNALALLLLRYVFKLTLSNPLESLMRQINKIEKGDYTASELLKTSDELESISVNIQNLASAVQERESDLHQSQENLKHLSNHDPLTNLPNRRLFGLRLDHAIELSKRSGTKAAVLFLDFDNFKQTNDLLGHNVGDLLLKVVSTRLKKGLRATDTLARIGGDEFVILLEQINSVNEVDTVIQKVFNDFKTPFIFDEHKINITASIGVAVYPDDGEDSVSIIKNADLAMYQSKEKGRNRHTFFSKKLSDFVEEHLKHTQALRSAIEENEQFSLLYQPKISLQNEITAVEALIRWNSTELGTVDTEKFIALAEETRHIISIGEWVLHQACSDFVKLRHEGYALEHVSINVSSIQLIHSDMPETLTRVIAATGIEPQQIELEITESYIATDTDVVLQTLHKIRAMGVMLAIDDFGTGYSSMSYLQKLPVTRLKIDKSFIDGLPDSQENVAITKAIIALARTFGLKITAEGVETAAQMRLLKELQCDEIQGYFYAKPLTFEALKTFCKSHNA